MGKPSNEDKTRGSETKVLFKRSCNTMFTNSTCCTGASQLVTKSGCLQIMKNLQSSNNCSDGTNVKRDLSIETDACILRRYYKIKRHKMSNQGSSVVSKYSTVVDTEIETIEEFPDTSACGDNDIMEVRSNHRIDIEALMVDNLKNLLGQWIQKNLFYNKDTQNKLDTVLDSILNKLDSQNVHEASSDSTYVIHKTEKKQAVKNKKIATSSVTWQYCKSCRDKIQSSSTISRKDSSTVTIPCNYKGIKIISTLSMPRSFHKPRLCQQDNINSSAQRSKKIKRKNVTLSISKSKWVRNSSSFDLIAISTKSLTKRCANCDSNLKKKKHIFLLPKPTYKKTSNSTTTTNQENPKITKIEVNKNQLGDMPSLLKSIYTTSIDKNVQFNTKNDNFTITENIPETYESHNVSNILTQNNISHKASKQNTIYVKRNNQYEYVKQDMKDQLSFSTKSPHIRSKTSSNFKKSIQKGKSKRKRHIIGHTSTHCTKLNSVNKRFTCLYKQTNTSLPGREFLKYCRNVFQYISDNDNNKNIKVDIRINVFPMLEPKTKDVYTDVSTQALNIYNIDNSPPLLYDDDNVGSTTIESQQDIQPTTVIDMDYEQDPTISTSQCTGEIIPILDGAVSQAQYIFNDNSREKTDVKSDVATGDTITNQLGILQEISELRAVIKDLATTAEKFVNEQIKKPVTKTNAQTYFSLDMSDNFTLNSKNEVAIERKNISKTTQISVDFEKNQPQSDTMNEPKKQDTFDYYNRLTKKSTSYRIIDSESLLKVTDMTSRANEINQYNRRFADEALTCSLPKSRSLFEMTSDRNKKLIAFFCDNCVTPKVNIRAHQSRWTAPSPCKSSRMSMKSKRWCIWSKKDTSKGNICQQIPRPIPLPITVPEGGYSSTSGRSINSVIDEEDELVCKLERRGMGFGEGCVYCMLLWIPVVIILIVFYAFVLKEGPPSVDKSNITETFEGPQAIKNSSKFQLKLSELGF